MGDEERKAAILAEASKLQLTHNSRHH